MSDHPAVVLERAIMSKMPELHSRQLERAKWKDIIVGTRRRRSVTGRKYDEPQLERMMTWPLTGGRGMFILTADESIAQFHLIHRVNGHALVSKNNQFIGGWMRVHQLDMLPTNQLDALTRVVNQLET